VRKHVNNEAKKYKKCCERSVPNLKFQTGFAEVNIVIPINQFSAENK
jgi:hypothetical protein